jgi:hypothetical protein
MAAATEYQCFSVSRYHHTLPEFLSLSHIFHFADVMDLKRAFFRVAILTFFSIESSDEF